MGNPIEENSPVSFLDQIKADREVTQTQLLGNALSFYALRTDKEDSHKWHRFYTEIMTNMAFDVALPQLAKELQDQEVDQLALVLPLRGGLAMATPNTISHMKRRLKQANIDIGFTIWTQGLKRHPEINRAEVYFASGYVDQGKPLRTHAMIADWGVATGLTVELGAKELSQYGVPFENISVLAMTLTDEAETRLNQNCSGITVHAATRALTDERSYIYQISSNRESWIPVNPKDWGDEMWGMKKGSTADQIEVDIQEFENHLLALNTIPGQESSIRPDQSTSLSDYYRTKYLAA